MSALKRLIGTVFVLLSLVTLQGVSAQANPDACPQRVYKGGCARVIAFGKNPGTGRCCEFLNPCSVPPGWDVFLSREECEAARPR